MENQTMKLEGFDVGAPDIVGSSTPTETGFDVVAGGTDIWETSDQFHFFCTPLAGDFDLRVRVESAELTHPYTKIGVMVRADLQADAVHFMQWVFADNRARNNNSGGYEAQYRQEKGGVCVAIYPPNKGALPPDFPVEFPHAWLRVARKADVFTCWASKDGEHWTVYTQTELQLPQSAFVGLAVTSHEAHTPTHAQFRDFQLVQAN
jgi:regulation of enolase protein 1 (concanavalin A-like superfamily)